VSRSRFSGRLSGINGGIGMKRVEAIIRPHALDAVKDALRCFGIIKLTISEVHGHGSKRHTEVYRRAEYEVDSTYLKLELLILDPNAEQVITAITEAIPPAEAGVVVISTVDQVVRIRDGKRGENAL
jgi:nitrogen regulatory protein P-II 1